MTMTLDSRRALFCLLLVAASACRNAGGPQGGAFSMPPTPVEVATAKRGEVTDRFQAVGTVQANEQVTLVAEIDATIVDLTHKEGESVSRGEILARLDDAELGAVVRRAEALVEQSRTAHERTRRVVAERVRPIQDLDDASAALKVAEANLEVARVRLSKTLIRAPFSGVIGARLVSPGAWLRAGDAVLRLVDVSEVKTDFAVPERYLSLLRVGAPVSISSTAYLDWRSSGQIDLIDPSVDPGTRNLRMRARVPNPDGKLRPGMSVDVGMVLAARGEAISIPGEAVFAEGDRFYAYRVNDDGSVARTALTLGAHASDSVEILSGLEAGHKVVRSGHQKLFEGARVQAIEPPAAGDASASPAGGQR